MQTISLPLAASHTRPVSAPYDARERPSLLKIMPVMPSPALRLKTSWPLSAPQTCAEPCPSMDTSFQPSGLKAMEEGSNCCEITASSTVSAKSLLHCESQTRMEPCVQ